MTKPKLGDGTRFKALTGELAKKGATNPGALAAVIGRRRYGKAKFQAMAAKGQRVAARRRAADAEKAGQ